MRDSVKKSLFLGLTLTLGLGAEASAGEGVIRLGNVPQPLRAEPDSERVQIEQPRRGFNFEAFGARLESLWFQRKTFLASGRENDGAQQLERIRAFASEEGVKRLEHLAGALIAEAERYTEEGNYERALASLYFAEAFDPGRPQVHFGRAMVYWQSDQGYLAPAAEIVKTLRASVSRSIQDLTLFHRAAFVVGLALIAFAVTFSLIVLLRYQTAFRHEVEEWARELVGEDWPVLIGWVALGLPLLTWIGAGWAIVYWIVISFRFMARQERIVAMLLLSAGVLTAPLYGMAVGLYGTAADPAVRATVVSVGGEYDPDRIVRLRQLVDGHPDDPVYRFLLAGLYKNGRYFEESFTEYKRVLEVNPTLAPAHINIGNIFYATGQYSEAITNYRRALDIDPHSFLAYFNLHLAQSEDFRFSAADESLRVARTIDSDRVAQLLSAASGWGDRPAVQDASLRMGSVWEAAIGGRRPIEASSSRPADGPQGLGWLHSASLIYVLALAGCVGSAFASRSIPPARRCIRCGRPFCHHCKSGREAREYCSQCLHLYVLRDGLAPGTKSRKVYEVERYERITSRIRSLLSICLPGATHLLRGKTGRAIILLMSWFVALIVARPSVLAVARFVGFSPYPELLVDSTEVPLAFNTNPLVVVACVALPMIWLAGNAWRWRRTES